MAKNQPGGTRGEIPLCKAARSWLVLLYIEVPFFSRSSQTSITVDKQVMTFKKDHNFIKVVPHHKTKLFSKHLIGTCHILIWVTFSLKA